MRNRLSLFAVLALGLAAVVPAWAGPHNHVYFGVTIGPPYWRPWYYPPPPYYYYPPVVVQQAPPAPPVYVEQPTVVPAPAAPAPESYWYFCQSTGQYYPYVKTCAVPWQKVAPQPPSAP